MVTKWSDKVLKDISETVRNNTRKDRIEETVVMWGNSDKEGGKKIKKEYADFSFTR